VPDSVFDAESNPDGKEKLAKLVQMCEALYDMATYFDIPLTSGKDSMKNDFKSAGVKISVPPTILYSMTAKIEDVRKVVTSDFKSAGDLIYQVGATYDELGGSEFYQLRGELGKNVPRVRKAEAKATYTKMIAAHEANLLQSSHDLSDGGLAVSLAESCWGGGLGAQIDLQELAQKSDLDATRLLFSESHSRFVVSIKATDKARFEAIFGDTATLLGAVQPEKLQVSQSEKTLIAQNSSDLMAAWESRKLI
jgi:phosphoribosylformylglycinamidine synthase